VGSVGEAAWEAVPLIPTPQVTRTLIKRLVSPRLLPGVVLHRVLMITAIISITRSTFPHVAALAAHAVRQLRSAVTHRLRNAMLLALPEDRCHLLTFGATNMASYRVDGFLDDRSGKQPFYLEISEPQNDKDGNDYFCRVHCPSLLGRDREIYGADEKQARELALQLVKQILGDRRLVDQDGKPLKL